MGFDTASIKFVCAAKSFGVDFTSTMMIGRQSFFSDATSLQRVFSILKINHDSEDFLRKNSYAEEFFSLLGAREINSLDYSSYESATILHDMNLPIPDGLRRRFSVVYDGGTLEHIFNVVQALKNCMEMVRVGGHFVQLNHANNFMGHGFWQFSPELIFRAFSAANGYQVEAVLLHEAVPGGAWYMVTDPDRVQQRVELCNSLPTYIFTIAKRVADVEIFARPPQQSDYVGLWNSLAREKAKSAFDLNASTCNSRKIDWPRKWHHYLPDSIQRVLRSIRRRVRPLIRSIPFDRPYYKRIREEDLLHGRLK